MHVKNQTSNTKQIKAINIYAANLKAAIVSLFLCSTYRYRYHNMYQYCFHKKKFLNLHNCIKRKKY
jgi:hypothetical protein